MEKIITIKSDEGTLIKDLNNLFAACKLLQFGLVGFTIYSMSPDDVFIFVINVTIIIEEEEK